MKKKGRLTTGKDKGASPLGKQVGLIIRKLRKEAGLSQKEFARKTGLTQPAICWIETGKVDIRLATLGRVLARIGLKKSALRVLFKAIERDTETS